MKLKASSEELVDANTLGPSGDSSQVFNRIEISQLKFYDYLIVFVLISIYAVDMLYARISSGVSLHSIFKSP